MNLNKPTFTLAGADAIARKGLIAGVIGFTICVVAFFVDREHFFFSYLTAFSFWATLALGALFFVMVKHITNARWSVAVRRMAETVMMNLPWLAILFAPVAFGVGALYHWSHAEAVAGDAMLQEKVGYLNLPFFFIRTGLYFAIWSFLTRYLYRVSLLQDTRPSETLIDRMRQVSASGMVLYALTLTFMAFDWLMSLDPHWYSTIFGVYVFVGGVIANLSFMTLISLALRKRGVMKEEITVEHYHDFGKLIFAFTAFWAYIAFSQYFLIWYGNIPEETAFYHDRWRGSWRYVSVLIGVGHFVAPFLLLITRAAKRNLRILTVASFWMLFMHWVDLYWLALPNFLEQGPSPSWIDLGAMLGVGGIFMWLFWSRFAAHPIVPVGDRRLDASFNFTNA